MLKVNLDGLKDLVKRFDDPALKAELNKIPSMKGVAAIILNRRDRDGLL